MLKLLIIDDEKWTRDGLRKCISWKSLGIGEIMDVADGKSGLEIALSFRPEIILSDIRMPKMTGIEFATRIRKELPDSKIIFISGYSDKEYLKSAIQLKAFSYIEKPINSTELIRTVKTAIDEYQTELECSRTFEFSITRLNQSIPYIKQELATKLIEHNTSNENINTLINLAGENMPVEGCYLAILYNLTLRRTDVSHEFESKRQTLLNILAESYKDENIYHISGIKDNLYIVSNILLNLGQNTQTLRRITERIRSSFANSLNSDTSNYSLYIGIGTNVSGIGNLAASYQTALLAVQRLSFLDKCGTAVYEESNSSPFIFTEELELKFEKLLLANDKPGVYGLVNSTVDGIMRHENALIDNVKNFFYNLLLRLKNISDQNCIRLYDGPNEIDYLWKFVSNALTLQELYQYLQQTIDTFFGAIEEKSGTSLTVYKIKSFIQINYMDRNLSVNYISEHLHFTPAYLCQVFKKEVGTTIHDYINQIRISKAKVLLKDKDIKVFEVALSCGFNEVRYFTKLFKILTGKTPSKFREEALE